MHVYRYSEKMQEQLGSKIKPEPWLHCTYSVDAGNKAGKYVIFIWDSRQVVEEGKLARTKLFTKSYNGRFSQYHFDFTGQPARDNGKPLQGAKFDWKFDEDDAVPQMKISAVRQFGPNVIRLIYRKRRNSDSVYTTDPGVSWDIACDINGHVVVFKTEPQRFSMISMPSVQCNLVEVDGERHKLCKGEPFSFSDVKIKPVGRIQHFVGQKYQVEDFSKKFIGAFVNMMNKEPEMFTATFKNAIK